MPRRPLGSTRTDTLFTDTPLFRSIYDRKEMKTTFADVAGVDEAKEELKEIVEFLRNPKKYQRLGGRIPKGVLLLGPPGCGKTQIGRAHVRTPVTNAHLVCRLRLEQKTANRHHIDDKQKYHST